MLVPESPRTWGLGSAVLSLFVASLLPAWLVCPGGGWCGTCELAPLWALALGGRPEDVACWDATQAAVILLLGYVTGRLAHRATAPYLRDRDDL
jgi:hypothetical protein